MVSHEHYNSTQPAPQPAPQTGGSEGRIADGESKPCDATALTLNLPPVNMDLSLQDRPAEAMRLAQEAFTQTSNWIEFFRESLGVHGFVRKLFRTPEEVGYFEETREHGQIHEMLTALRSQDTGKGDTLEPQRMITVRLPKSLHEYLRVQAEEHGLSINKLCISKLLQTVDETMVPEERGGRRGRRPGPQGPRKRKAEPETTPQPQATSTYGTSSGFQSAQSRAASPNPYQHPTQRPHFG